MLFVRLFDLCLFGFVCFLFLLVSGKGCGLWLWHSLDFSFTFLCVLSVLVSFVPPLVFIGRVCFLIVALPGNLLYYSPLTVEFPSVFSVPLSPMYYQRVGGGLWGRGALSLRYGKDVRLEFLWPYIFIYSANIKIYTYSYICLQKYTLFIYYYEDFMTIYVSVLGVLVVKTINYNCSILK